jgi:hypothetical protein
MVRLVALLVCSLLVLAGCLSPPAAVEPQPAEPADDALGWENGYWHNESIAVDQSDGLNESELDSYVARTKARVERIRGLEFEESVPVEVISRAEYRNRSGSGSAPARMVAFRNQVWESLLLVGEDTDADDALREVYGSSVQGYYSPGAGEIVLVSDSPGNLTVDRRTLVHELTHALQDQHFGLHTAAPTIDERRARTGATEGDANYVQYRYEDRCEAEWECRPLPSANRSGSGEYDLGLFVAVFHPYSEGPVFVRTLQERGGWDLVNEVIHARHPESTEQVSHPGKFGSDQPREVRVPDRSTDRWSRFSDLPGRDRPWDTVGEASLYATFWANGVIEREHVRSDDDPDSRYNYSHPITHGWDGDRVVPYRTADGASGYVFASVWDDERNATEFREAYERLLVEVHNATEVREGVYRVPEDDPFGDAFRVRQNGDRVVVVNAPSVEELEGVHATEPPN